MERLHRFLDRHRLLLHSLEEIFHFFKVILFYMTETCSEKQQLGNKVMKPNQNGIKQNNYCKPCSLQLMGRQVALWLESWMSNQKVARSNPRAYKVKVCRFTPGQGS